MTIGNSTIYNLNIKLLNLGNILISPTLLSTVIFGISGIVFAISNLILARFLPEMEFAIFALVFSLLQIGRALGPGGFDVIINRHKLKPSFQILYRVFLIAFIIGSLIAFMSRLVYNVSFGMLLIILLGTITSSTNRLSAAHYQSKENYGLSLCLSQSPNIFLALAALVCMSLKIHNAWVPCAIVVIGYAISFVIGWINLLPYMQVNMENNLSNYWREMITIIGFNGALLIMMQLERLIVPKILTINVLATLAVLMTIVGSPFRMLQLGTTFTMLPRFRSAYSIKERRRLLFVEGAGIFSVAILSSIAVWFVAPILLKWFLSGKYIISDALILSAIIVGFIKLIDAMAFSALTALGTSHELGRLNYLSWIAVGISVLGAYVGSIWGLLGVIYGVGFGWLFRATTASIIVMHYFKPNPD